jgi:nitrogen-specific signal transduction histidine kinase
MFAASIAHEIKNPLVAIKTFAQLVPRRHGEERFLEDFSRVVTREIGRIERLLERLRSLGVAKVQTLDGIKEEVQFPLPKGLSGLSA